MKPSLIHRLFGLLDEPAGRDRIRRLLVPFCLGLVGVDALFALGLVERHPYHSFENLIGFPGLMGFAGLSAVVLAGHLLQRVLHRDETFYDR